ncbi:MAG: hypothetical protein AAGF01_21780 [Cyanobacteria bacterium P01_G01_bin.38]
MSWLKKLKLQTVLWLLGGTLAISGWLCYLPFVYGHVPGIYPLAMVYRTLFVMPAALGSLGFLYLWPIVISTALISGVLSRLTGRRIFRRVLLGGLLPPLLLITVLPAMITCDPGPSLTVAPWGRVYRLAYSSLAIDDNYGTGLVFECDRTGIICHQVHQFPGFIGMLEHLSLSYDPEGDRLIVGHERDPIYLRSGQE